MESERTTRTQKKEIDFIIIEKKSIILLPNSPQEGNASTILLYRKTVPVKLDCHGLIIKKNHESELKIDYHFRLSTFVSLFKTIEAKTFYGRVSLYLVDAKKL